MLPKLKQQIWQWLSILIAAPSVAGLVIAASYVGCFQLFEWSTLDQFMRLRPPESKDPRLVIITIDNRDLELIGQWPIPDQTLAQLLHKIKAQQPRIIGVHLYRPLPVQPGAQELLTLYESTPDLYGVEKFVGQTISAPQFLAERDQVGISDLVLDADGKLRRALIAILPTEDEIRFSIGAQLALRYLEAEGITYEQVNSSRWGLFKDRERVKLGKAVFERFRANDGGYVGADDGGFQVLLNFRGTQTSFQTIGMRDVLDGKLDPELIRDRVVLIGSTAESFNTFFHTPYSTLITPENGDFVAPHKMSGVFIHANVASQMMSAALDNRPLIRVWHEQIEWLWICGWSLLGSIVSWQVLQANRLGKNSASGWLVISIFLTGSSLVSISYLIFLAGWWVPVIAPFATLIGSAIMISSYHQQGLQRLASLDSLTNVANRHYFDQYLQQEWWQVSKGEKQLSLILCDVDYFKSYNDTYGHQAGDGCLQQVAQAITYAVRPTDLVARYGGEEFVVILPHTDAQIATQVANRIRTQVKALSLAHSRSQVCEYVTLSCGVAHIVVNRYSSPTLLITRADEALYEAKSKGRDRVILNVNP